MRFQRGICAAFFIGLGSLAVIEGCSLVTDYDGFYGASPKATCGDRIPANTAKGSSAVDMGKLVGAAQTFRFLDVDGALPPKLGVDLDQNCQTTACEPNLGLRRDAGVDNVLGGFIGKLPRQADISVQPLRSGAIGLIVEVTGWNGTDSDDSLQVNLFNVAGLNGDTDGGGQRMQGGNDVYIPREDDFVRTGPLMGPSMPSRLAYVTKKQLVANFVLVRLRVITPNATPGKPPVTIEIVLNEAALLGTIELVQEGIRMADAQLVGRVFDRDILQNLAQIGYCSDTAGYPMIKAGVCGVIDLTDSINTDGKRRPCTAGSIAVGLDLAPARMATTTAPAPPDPPQCAMGPVENCGGR